VNPRQGAACAGWRTSPRRCGARGYRPRGANDRLIEPHLLSTSPPLPDASQAKLRVDDSGEDEADHVALQIVRMRSDRSLAGGAHDRLSRKCADCEEEKLQKKSTDAVQINDSKQRRVYQSLRAPGQPLDGATRAFFESRFRYDFSNVRVHHDLDATASAHELNAHAYTVGNHIVFGSGQFAPATEAGLRLLAHELGASASLS
jgi:Domain of unknown function (DUF4157)